jgi:hypothetical protein
MNVLLSQHPSESRLAQLSPFALQPGGDLHSIPAAPAKCHASSDFIRLPGTGAEYGCVDWFQYPLALDVTPARESTAH